ncbi:OLC1v1001231C1 [Oldenlandia corymbosa var. corymbosa]|uniref:OLC1v1001231C1 n=1 Tax=Oldenlandia corymbosa var. corymbosa TaxID=529605 RepID=A0AAV1D5M2_OLDCO|nr:OLC1v1001231C1 [Oldenlandia corymbosa var. corymbosa]
MERNLKRGRQRIEMKRIEIDDHRYASFSKRKVGVFKKASELCTECKADVGVIIFSPAEKTHTFFSPNIDKIVSSCFGKNQIPNDTQPLIEEHEKARADNLNQQLDEVEIQTDIQVGKAKQMNAVSTMKDECGSLGVLEEELDSMEKNVRLKLKMANFIVQLANHSKMLKN